MEKRDVFDPDTQQTFKNSFSMDEILARTMDKGIRSEHLGEIHNGVEVKDRKDLKIKQK